MAFADVPPANDLATDLTSQARRPCAAELGVSGCETPAELDADDALCARLESIRLGAGPMMNLGDVEHESVPRMTIVGPPRAGGTIATRTFIPHRCHRTVGVPGAVSVATACLTPGAVGHDLAHLPKSVAKHLPIEHPAGEMIVVGHVENGQVVRPEVLRTARKLMDGVVF